MSRHLVVVDKSINKTARRDLKRHRKSNVDMVSAEDFCDVCTLTDAKKTEVKRSDAKFEKWDTISLIFNSYYDENDGRHCEHDQSQCEDKRYISLMGLRLRVDVDDDRFMNGAHYDTFTSTIECLGKLVSQDATAHSHHGIYLYVSNVGCIPGVQQLLKGKPTQAVTQVYVSAKMTENGENDDWEIEWGNLDWYVLTNDQRKHAKRHLFSRLDAISLTE
jgi:hypothetical protein